MSKKSHRKAGRTSRYTRKDGTVVEYHYGPYQPKPRERATDTLTALIEAYRRSRKWRGLAAATQRTYAVYHKYLERIGHTKVVDMKRRDLLDLVDVIAERRGPGAAVGFARSASALFAWAVYREWIEHSPATKIVPDGGGELRAWTRAEADAAVGGLPEHLRRVVILARYTGQRRGDLCAMRWSAYDGITIQVKQQKTGEELVLTAPANLRVELDTWKREASALTILTNRFGRPWDPQQLSHALPVALAKIGLSDELNVHGLRKLAATELADAGCTTHQIAAVTGHRTLAMVQHYTKTANQRSLAEAAVVLLQNADKNKKTTNLQ